MTINYDVLMAAGISDLPVSYTDKDSILYALGVGFGRDPLDPSELPYVYERPGPHSVPTFSSMLVNDTIVAESGCDLTRVLHRTQTLDLYRPLPPNGEMLANQRVIGVFDHGADKGAEIEIESELRLARNDSAICTMVSRIIARSDGGFGGPPPRVRQRHRLPNREPDMSCDLETRPNQALLFRLSGDYNPLHADTGLAREAGFDAPILHGRCTYGIACLAVLKTVCNYDFTLIRGFDVRFRAPVYPGDIITTDIWQDRNIVSFRCRVRARNVVVISNGKCTLAAE
jgi:acyl dehydratase